MLPAEPSLKFISTSAAAAAPNIDFQLSVRPVEPTAVSAPEAVVPAQIDGLQDADASKRLRLVLLLSIMLVIICGLIAVAVAGWATRS